MLLTSAIQNEIVIPKMGATSSQSADVFKIEVILRRAREIHRQHGGIFGYDFEDWSEAWGELPQSGSRRERRFAAENGVEFLRELETEVCE